MMRLLVLTLCCLPSLAMAQSPLGGDITLATGEGRIMRFSDPVDAVMIAEPGVADLQVVSPGVIYLFLSLIHI